MTDHTHPRRVDQPPIGPPDWPHPGIAGPIAELQRRVSLRGVRTSDDFMTGLGEVVHDDPAFVDLFAGTVWGHIVWAKNVGRPLSPRLADAFVIVHKYQLIKGVANPGGSATNVGGWVDAAAPTLWDGPHDDGHYRVSFMLQGAYPWTNGVGIHLTPSIEWEPHVAPWLAERVRYVAYPASLEQTAGAFWPTKTGITDLDDFEVRWSPF
jgi:hypothetical protein